MKSHCEMSAMLNNVFSVSFIAQIDGRGFFCNSHKAPIVGPCRDHTKDN
jgi:hypothetical protein